MSDKKCMVFETLGSINGLQIQESKANEVRMSGIFGVCGVRNNNKRIYNKENYGRMVESLQQTILTEGCPGELEHPNSMNINLENVSHKIEEIHMNEDGTVTGTILLLNTPKGQIAKAIVEGGLPLYISSRGAGNIDQNGNVMLQTIKTFDLVGTPGFSQAKLSLKENQTYESLCESADGYSAWAIIENDESDKDDDSKKDDESKKEKDTKDSKNEETNKTDDNVSMEDLKKSIDELSEKVTKLEAELHVAQESLKEANDRISGINEVNYNAIESWVKEECLPEYKDSIIKEMAEFTEGWIVNEVAPTFEGWVTEEFAPKVEGWVTEEFGAQVEGWVTEEFAQVIDNWITEEHSPELKATILKEAKESFDNAINEAKNEINANVSAFLEAKKEDKYSSIDKMLECLSSDATSKEDALALLKENQDRNNPYKGLYVVENMPVSLRPSWELLDESRKNEVVRMSRMYDFTKQGVLESFWNSVDFKAVNESKNTPAPAIENDYHNSIASQMMRMRTNR